MNSDSFKNVRYAIGLDIGIASVGSALVALDESDKPCGIIHMGSRIFAAAEVPNKGGASLAATRRSARSARRRLRRHRHRIERIRSLLVSENVLTAKQMAELYTDKTPEDVYTLRVRALDFPITPQQFSKVLIHLAQRRGFKSNRKAAASDQENGKLLAAVDANKKRMEKGGYRTIGEMFLKDPEYRKNKRNKGESYISTVARSMVEDEARQIFQAQRRFGQPFANEDLEKRYLDILLSQRSFDEGPGGDSPYGGSQIEKMRGMCTFLPQEKRAPKASYSFELSRLLEKINHLRIYRLGDVRALNAVEREAVLQKAFRKERMTYADVRAALQGTMDDTERFVGINYEKEAKKPPENVRFVSLPGYHALRKALNTIEKDYIKRLSTDKLDQIAEVLTLYKQDRAIKEQLEAIGCTPDETAALMLVPSFSGFGHLCVKVCRMLIPYLKEGDTYDAACARAGFDHRAHDKRPEYLLKYQKDDMASVTSPVVLRAVSQTIKVINACIRYMGHSPVYINVELAREMSKTYKERSKLESKIRDNEERNEKIVNELIENHKIASPSGQDIVKLKLYHEQGGLSAYSLRPFDLNRLFEPGYAEVDHIVPYSISFNDSYNNKALIFTGENREKGNHLPLEYLKGDAREQFIVHTKNASYRQAKKLNLLKEKITEEDRQRYKQRNLQDTRHIARFIYNYINDYLLFEPSERKKHVTAVNGAITAHLRKRWGLTKERSNGDLHHALDATVIACATDRMIQEISRYYDRRESAQYMMMPDGNHSVHSKTGELFPMPWPGFRDDILARMGDAPAVQLRSLRDKQRLPGYDRFPQLIDRATPIFVSRMPRRKVSGPAHEDTIKRKGDVGETVKRVSIQELKLDKDGEIAKYYRPDDDRKLYEALKARLHAYGGDGTKAFAEPIYKPAAEGRPASPVYKVKIVEKSSLGVDVHQGKGVADNGSMVRIDLYYVPKEGYYFVPIYVSDTVLPELPNKACTRGKVYAEWKKMNESGFVFSLYPEDPILITPKNKVTLKVTNKDSSLPASRTLRKNELLYFSKADISVATICCKTHDNSYTARPGIKSIPKIEKYQVDIMGNVSKVGNEKRMPFQRK